MTKNPSGQSTHALGFQDGEQALSWKQACTEIFLLVMLCFVYAGDPPPMVNEAHYLVKAKNYWNPDWCSGDLFTASGKAHTTFYAIFGWPTRFVSLEATAWMGRWIGWLVLAIGLWRLSSRLIPRPWISLGVAVIWITGIEHGNLAGEWVVGGIEAKVPAYGLLLLALSEVVCRRWSQAWILLGAASAFHVLTGGWGVIAAMFAWWTTERRREDRQRLFRPALFVGGAIALFGLIPAVWLTSGASTEDSTVAARIYTYYRLKHHLLPADFATWWYIRHGVLIALTFAASAFCFRQARIESWDRMYAFSIGAVLIAITGLGVGFLPSMMPDLAARLLRFYWFRLADAVVPLMFALLVMRLAFHRNPVSKSAGWIALVISVVLFAWSSFDRGRMGIPPAASNRVLGWDADATPEAQRAVFDDWMKVCRWVRASAPEDEIFLTPRHQQTFKWYAERAEVVNNKDVPQDAASLREWYRRFRNVFPSRLGTIRVTIRYEDLREYRESYGVRFMIVDRRVTGENLPLVKLYPNRNEENETFAVYELP